ncbi:MAG: hypothetical protein IT455_12705 [Planctomycetes bacterium]|nr:hypothetical protein [Planctomycetota bacterium]
MTRTRRATKALPTPAADRLLPAALLALPLAKVLAADLTARLTAASLLTVGDLLHTRQQQLDDATATAIRDALDRVLQDGLRQFAEPAALDFATVRAHLLGPLDDDGRALLGEALGFDAPPPPRPELARHHGVELRELDNRLDRQRDRLRERAGALLSRLREEVTRELAAFDGVLHPFQAAKGTLLQVLTAGGNDQELGLRVAAFCLPGDVHLHDGVLCGLPPRRFRQLLRTLPALVPQHRLPLPLDVLLAELHQHGIDTPRGLLQHVLRRELHVAIELDAGLGEVAAADPLRPAARLVEILREHGGPMPLADLRFAYRERFRFAGESTLRRHLQRSDAFVHLGADLWSLRCWHQDELAAVMPIVDRIARQIATTGGRQHVADLLRERDDDRTEHLVLDRLGADPRVRLLGRGDACAATHNRSRVMEQLLQDFRRAAGDVVLGRFLENQPAANRRLVERLLRHNRLFVQPAPDRIDTLSNYPFNAERMRRLLQLVTQELQDRAGYAPASALKTAVDRSDLGGDWLTPELLADVLRRNGPFEVLPGLLVAHADLALAQNVVRQARQAMRDAGGPVTVDDVLRARPELAEFADCLGELLGRDPLVQTPDGTWFTLA